jgi:hypothetical protein
MLVDVKQNELDLAETKLLESLFGSTELDAKAQWLLKFFNIDINNTIQTFENLMKPLMLDNGMVDASLTRSLVATKYPLISNIIPSQNFRLVDIVNELTTILKGTKG